jgi:phage head maturation protease
MVRRGVDIVELSLVHWPAYQSAGIVSVNQRSAADDIAHTESERVKSETLEFLARMRS